VREAERPKLFPGGGEQYFVRGGDGKFYRLRIAEPHELAAELGVNVLAEALSPIDAPLLVYPAVAQRGKNGIPGEPGKPIPVILQQAGMREPVHIDSRMKDSMRPSGVRAMILAYVLGKRNFDPGRDLAHVRGGIGDEFSFINIDGVFDSYGGAKETLTDYLKTLPKDFFDVGRSHPKEAGRIHAVKTMYDEIRVALKKISGLPPMEVEASFGPYFAELNQRRAAKGLPSIDYIGSVR
jgi:hypothetical protein